LVADSAETAQASADRLAAEFGTAVTRTAPEATPRTEWKVPLTLDQVTSIATDIAGKIRP
jgi:hypothetical protein